MSEPKPLYRTDPVRVPPAPLYRTDPVTVSPDPDPMYTYAATCFELADPCPVCGQSPVSTNGRLVWCHVCGWYGDYTAADGHDVRDPANSGDALPLGVS